jgi:FAD synthetase
LTKVLASGVFDLLHYGHLRYLEEAKRAGGPEAELIVVIATDETVRRMKGMDPVMPEGQRCALMEALEVVDHAILGFIDMDLETVLEEIQPDIVALGYDQDTMAEKVENIKREKGMDIKVVRVGHYGGERLSSSKIKKRIAEDWRKQL